MNEDLITKAIIGMERHLAACDKYLTELAKGYRSAEKVNILLDAAMQQIELCCLDMRVLCEKVRPASSPPRPTHTAYSCKSICGEVYGMENGWLNIRLNTLLPHCKVMGGTQYIADTITRLLDKYQKAIQSFIDNGCDSPKVIERWMQKIAALQQKKKTYEEVLQRQLDDLNSDYRLLQMQSQELYVRNVQGQMKMVA